MTNMISDGTKPICISPLADLFATDTLAAVLSRFSLEPQRTFYQRELVSLTGASLFLVQRELARLERAGLIVRDRNGQRVEYNVVTAHPAWAGLRDMLLRTVALADVLLAALKPLEDRIEVAFAFGPAVRGGTSVRSLVDLLVVGEVSTLDIVGAIAPAERILAREVNPVVYRPDEIRRRLRSGESYVSGALRGPRLILLGHDDVLRDLPE